MQLLGQHRVGRLELDVDRLLVDLLRAPITPFSWNERCEVGASARSIENTASSAVNGVPSWKRHALAQLEAPGRGIDRLPRQGQRGSSLNCSSRLTSDS